MPMIGMPLETRANNFLFASRRFEDERDQRRCFASGRMIKIGFAKIIAGFDVAQPDAGFALQRIEIVEVGDMRQSR